MATDIAAQVEPEVRRHLDGPLGPMISRLEAIAKQVADRGDVTIDGIDVQFMPLMKQRGRPFVAFTVKTGLGVLPDDAFEYRHALGDEVDVWLFQANGEQQDQFDSSIHFSVEWIEPNGS